MKVAIYGQTFKSEDTIYVEELLQELISKKVEIVIEKSYYNDLKEVVNVTNYSTFSSFSELNTSFNFMFTIGGDGTILRAVTFIRNSNIPIVGINTGRLGFLATVQKEDIKVAVDLIFEKKYLVKDLNLISVTTKPEMSALKSLNFALNEISISRKNTVSMITIETFLDNEFLNSYWADGLIIATPTGSTGYSLSCGGPIITPQSANFALTPIAPHNLNARPLVIPNSTKIKIKVSGRENQFFLSLDSRNITINSNTEIYLQKADFTVKMVQINKQTFIKTLREKLLWGLDTRN